ncbi:MAG: alpha/beta fold hydrolase [Povalibacter sp.]
MQMKRQLLFIQGAGEGTHDEWDDKLVASLRKELGPDFEIRYPRLPNEDAPSYSAWKPALEKSLLALEDGAIAVGHSVGATILIAMLAEQSSMQRLGAIVLIAPPFVGDGGWPSEDMQLPDDLGARLGQDVPVLFFNGLEDDTVPPAHAERYARLIPQARFHPLPGRDHQLNNDLKEVAVAILQLQTQS